MSGRKRSQPHPAVKAVPRRGGKAPTVEGAQRQPREQPHTSELLLTIDQAARRLNIGRSLMYKLIWEGSVTSLMVGRFRRVAVEELERYIVAGMLAERLARFGRSA